MFHDRFGILRREFVGRHNRNLGRQLRSFLMKNLTMPMARQDRRRMDHPVKLMAHTYTGTADDIHWNSSSGPDVRQRVELDLRHEPGGWGQDRGA